jgi:hypothetical protein
MVSKHCHDLAVLSRLPIRPTCPVRPGCLVLVVLSQMSYPRCLGLTCLSCPGCPVPAVLLQLPCPGHLVHCPPDSTFMSWQSCYLCTFQTDLSRLTYQADLLRLSCPDCPIPSFLSRLSCPGCPVPAVLSEWSCPRCPLSTAPVVPSRLSFLSYPVLAVTFRLFCLGCLSWPYYPSCLL